MRVHLTWTVHKTNQSQGCIHLQEPKRKYTSRNGTKFNFSLPICGPDPGSFARLVYTHTANTVLSMNNQILSLVCSYKYVGFTLDEHLNFNKHFEELKNLVSHKLYLLSKLGRYLTKDECITIFKTMILSLLEYSCVIFRGTGTSNISKVNKLFYRGLRFCTNNNYHETKEKLRS